LSRALSREGESCSSCLVHKVLFSAQFSKEVHIWVHVKRRHSAIIIQHHDQQYYERHHVLIVIMS